MELRGRFHADGTFGKSTFEMIGFDGPAGSEKEVFMFMSRTKMLLLLSYSTSQSRSHLTLRHN